MRSKIINIRDHNRNRSHFHGRDHHVHRVHHVHHAHHGRGGDRGHVHHDHPI